MSGQVRGGAPWTRQAVAEFAAEQPESLARIEASIPDGDSIVIGAYRGTRGLWRAQNGMTFGEPSTSVGAACWSLLSKMGVINA